MYSLPYIIFMIVLALFGYAYHRFRQHEEISRIIICAGMSVIVIFLGLRGFCMFDWRNYYPEFQNITKEVADNAFGVNREIGWHIFVRTCKGIWDNYHFMVFVQSCMLIGLLYRFFKQNTPNVFLSFILFFAFDGFPISFNLMRNSLAIAIFLNAIPYIQQRKPLQFFGLCLIATCFHYSSLFYFPLYFVLHRRISKYVFAGYMLFCAAFYCLNIPVFENLAELVFGENEVVGKIVKSYTEMSKGIKISPVFLERIVTGCLIFCYYDKLHKIRDNAPIMINAFLLFTSATFLISDFSEISTRISALFVFSYWVLYADIIRCFNIPNNRRLFMTFVGMYCLFRTAMPMGNIVYKYDNILFGIQSFNQRAAIFDRNVSSDD